MKQITTQAIVLARTDFGEADRILTLLTPQQGKLRLMAKGVRRVKSKLAGGIELFSVSTITFIRGRGDIGTLVSARLDHHYGRIVTDITRTMLGYDMLKQLNRGLEDEPEPEYFEILGQVFAGLDDAATPIELVHLWFMAQLLRLGGHSPNLYTDQAGSSLQAAAMYDFDIDAMCFVARPDGVVGAEQIKFLRIALSAHPLSTLQKVQGAGSLAQSVLPLVRTMFTMYGKH